MAKYVTVGNSGTILTSNDGISWVLQASNTVSNLLSIATNGTSYVVGGSGEALISTDASTWKFSTLVPRLPSAERWGDKKSICVTTDKRIVNIVSIGGAGSGIGAYSTDGMTWVKTFLPVSTTWTACATNGTSFCAIAGYSVASNVAATSTDGITWTQSTLPANVTWRAIAASSSLYVALSNTNVYATSTNGITWTQRSMPINTAWSSIYWNGSIFAATSSTSGTSCATSTDGITWTTGTIPAGNNLTITHWTGTRFLGVFQGSFSTTVAISTNGLAWTTSTVPNGVYNDLVSNADNSLYFAANGLTSPGITSTDLITWTTVNQPSGPAQWGGCIWYNNKFLLFAGNNSQNTTLASSTDAIGWSFASNSGTAIYDVKFLNNLYVAIGVNIRPSISYSTDGYSWTNNVIKATTNALLSITYGASTYVAVGGGGTLLTSTDLINWTLKTSGTSTFNCVEYGAGLFVAVGAASTIVTSPDGITWTTRTAAVASRNLTHVSYTGNAFIVADASGSIHRSLNGISWISTYTGPAALYDTVYSGDNNSIVSVGASGTIIRSSI